EAALVQGRLVVRDRPLGRPERVGQHRPPPRALHEGLRAEGRDEHADRRDQPQDHHHDDGDADEPAALALLADAPHLASPGHPRGDSDLLDRHGRAHRMASCSRNRRTFHTMTGMMARNSTTAMAAPRPGCPRKKNHWIMRSAMTTVPRGSALPMANTMS